MKKIAVLWILVSTTSITFSQVPKTEFWILEEPIFKTTKDSADYARAQVQFKSLITDRTKFDAIDSLMKVIQGIRQRGIIGTRKVYSPSPGFTQYQGSIKNYDEIKHLSISEKGLRRIPKDVLLCKNLEALELVNTSIRKISKKLNGLSLLSSIYILNNKPSGKLKLGKNESVKTLGIRGVNPETIPTSFRKFRNLEKLDLAATGLTSFPKGASKNKKLKELLLSSNQIALEADRISVHPTLEKLELQKNKIKTLTASIRNFPNLKRLILNHNEIEHVDPAIASLTKLEHLSFYRNKLKAIPEGIYALQNLKEIDLYYNQIERFDDQISNLKNLEILYLSHNLILTVPESLCSLTQLEELYLSNNRLTELPQGMGSMDRLKVLRINNNRLLQAPRDLPKLIKLENLDISSNQLTELPDGLLTLQSLKLLVLVNNPWDETSLNKLDMFTQHFRNKGVVIQIEDNP